MSATSAQVAACRKMLAAAVARLPGARLFAGDRIYVGDQLVGERLGANIVTTDVREPAGTSTRVLLPGVTIYPSEGVEALVAAIAKAEAVRARLAEVRHAA